jgi:hypothetical protein
VLEFAILSYNTARKLLSTSSVLQELNELISLDLHPPVTSRTNVLDHNGYTSRLGDHGFDASCHTAFLFDFSSSKGSKGRHGLFEPKVVFQNGCPLAIFRFEIGQKAQKASYNSASYVLYFGQMLNRHSSLPYFFASFRVQAFD